MEGIKTPAGVIWSGTVVPALCVDLDGTIRRSACGSEFIKDASDVALYSGAEEKLWEYRDSGYLIFGLSNQGGVAFGYKTPKSYNEELDRFESLFTRNPFHSLCASFHHPDGPEFPYNKRSFLRKPDTGMLAYLEGDAFDAGYVVDWDNSLFVGDREEDRQCAENARIPFRWAHEFFGRTNEEDKKSTTAHK